MNELLKILTLVSVGNVHGKEIKSLYRKSKISTFFSNNKVKMLSTTVVLVSVGIAGLLYDKYKRISALSDITPILAQLNVSLMPHLLNAHQAQAEMFNTMKKADEILLTEKDFAYSITKDCAENTQAYSFDLTLSLEQKEESVSFKKLMYKLLYKGWKYFKLDEAIQKLFTSSDNPMHAVMAQLALEQLSNSIASQDATIESRLRNYLTSRYIIQNERIIEYQYKQNLLATNNCSLDISYINNIATHELVIYPYNKALQLHISTDVMNFILIILKQITNCSDAIKNTKPLVIIVTSDFNYAHKITHSEINKDSYHKEDKEAVDEIGALLKQHEVTKALDIRIQYAPQVEIEVQVQQQVTEPEPSKTVMQDAIQALSNSAPIKTLRSLILGKK